MNVVGGWREGVIGWGLLEKKVGNVNLVQTKKMKRNGYNIR